MRKNFLKSRNKYKILIFIGIFLFIFGVIFHMNSSTPLIETLSTFSMFTGIFLALGYPLSKILEDGVPVNDPSHINDERNKEITRFATYKTIQMTIPLILILIFVFIDNIELIIALLSILIYILVNLSIWRKIYTNKI